MLNNTYPNSEENQTLITQSNDSKNSKIGFIIFSVLLLISMLFSGSMTARPEKYFGVFACIAISWAGLYKMKSVKKSVTPLFVAVTGFILWAGIGTFYAVAKKFALTEMCKLLVGFAFFIALTAYLPKKMSSFKYIAYGITSVTTLLGLLSVDAVTVKLLCKPFYAIMNIFSDFYDIEQTLFDGSRIGSILQNANIYGGVMALGVILCFWLAFNSNTKKERIISSCMLGITAFAYVLAMSLVSILVCFIACLAMAIFSEKGSKISFIILMFETAIITLILMIASLGHLSSGGILPFLAVLLSGVILYFADSFIRTPLNKLISKNTKASIGVFSAVILLAVVSVYISLTATTGITLAPSSSLFRALNLPAGEYTLTFDTNNIENTTILIQSQNKQDFMRNSATVLYNDVVKNEISISVPEDSKTCNVIISSNNNENDVTINSISYRGMKSGSVPLKYKFLPDMVANRLQALTSSSSMQHRYALFDMSFKLFQKNPIIGRGLGGFENGIYSVQDYFYQTKYAHNHYLQTMCDMGIIGFTLYTSTLIISLVGLWKGRNGENKSLIPVTLALLISMYGSAITDVNWSSGHFIPIAFTILALVSIFFFKETKTENIKKSKYFTLIIGILSIVYGVLISMNIYANSFISEGMITFDRLEKNIKIDKFDANDYYLSYVMSGLSVDDAHIQENVIKYADKLSKVESNFIGSIIISYYLFQENVDKAFEIAENYTDYTRSSPEAWQELFNSLEYTISPLSEDGSASTEWSKKHPEAISKTAHLVTKLNEINSEQLDYISLSEKNLAFLERIGITPPLSNEEAKAMVK